MKILGFLFGIVVSAAMAWSHGQDLGSTATLEAIRAPASMRSPLQAARPEVVHIDPIAAVTAVAVSDPALQYQFGTALRHIRPGSAQTFFSRALVAYLRVPIDQRKAWDEFQMAYEDDELPTARDMEKALEPFSTVIDEILTFSRCEDLSWDLRIRDRQGSQRYSVFLDEVQLARELARILRIRALLLIERKEFAAAAETIRTGYRLAQFIRNGEMLIQQLVAIAIEGIMQDCVQHWIRAEDSPNLYFALASVVPDIQPLARAMEGETRMIWEFLPILADAETADWDEAVWTRKWQESFHPLQELGLSADPQPFALATEDQSAEDAKQRLVQAGYSPERVERMPAGQLVALDLALELRRLADNLHAAVYLDFRSAQRMFDAAAKGPGHEPASSIAQVMIELALPALRSTHQAHYRTIAKHQLLLTVEAVRDYAARHGGALPRTLAELDRLPAGTDPMTGQAIGYGLRADAEGEIAEFSIHAPHLPESLRVFRLRISNASSNTENN